MTAWVFAVTTGLTIGITVWLLQMFFREPVDTFLRNHRDKKKAKKIDKQKYNKLFEDFVTNMQGIWDGDAKLFHSPTHCQNIVEQFERDITPYEKLVKPKVHKIAIDTIERAKANCENGRVDVKYLIAQCRDSAWLNK